MLCSALILSVDRGPSSVSKDNDTSHAALPAHDETDVAVLFQGEVDGRAEFDGSTGHDDAGPLRGPGIEIPRPLVDAQVVDTHESIVSTVGNWRTFRVPGDRGETGIHVVAVHAAEVAPVVLPVTAIGSFLLLRIPRGELAYARAVLVAELRVGCTIPHLLAVTVDPEFLLADPHAPGLEAGGLQFLAETLCDVLTVQVARGLPVVPGKVRVDSGRLCAACSRDSRSHTSWHRAAAPRSCRPTRTHCLSRWRPCS